MFWTETVGWEIIILSVEVFDFLKVTKAFVVSCYISYTDVFFKE